MGRSSVTKYCDLANDNILNKDKALLNLEHMHLCVRKYNTWNNMNVTQIIQLLVEIVVNKCLHRKATPYKYQTLSDKGKIFTQNRVSWVGTTPFIRPIWLFIC